MTPCPLPNFDNKKRRKKKEEVATAFSLSLYLFIYLWLIGLDLFSSSGSKEMGSPLDKSEWATKLAELSI